MNCAEFRNLWSDNRDADEAPLAVLRAHTATCADCASWTARTDALDLIFQDALFVAPPPDLTARLREMALATPAVAPSPWWNYLPEFLVVAFLALGLLGLSGDTSAALGSLAVQRVGDAFLAVSVFFNPPLVGYLANLWGTLLEASAALLMLALLISRALGSPSERSTD